MQEVEFVSTGFLHVRREVYDTIKAKFSIPTCEAWSKKPLTPYFQPMIKKEGDRFSYLSEAYSFCERARMAGFPIVADTSIRLWHIGQYPYGWEDAVYSMNRQETFQIKQ